MKHSVRAQVQVLTDVYGDPLLADVSPLMCLLAMLLIQRCPAGTARS